MSFSYPRHFAFEADLFDAASQSWTLSGNDVKIMIFRFATELSVGRSFVTDLAAGFGPKSTISPIPIQLGPVQYSGKRIRARFPMHEFTQDVLPLPSVKGRGRFLILQDDASGAKPESHLTRALLSKTFQITQCKPAIFL